jgi:hypothetical protein
MPITNGKSIGGNSGVTDLVQHYLEHFCFKANGNLSGLYTQYYNKTFLEDIERKVKVFMSDDGMKSVPNIDEIQYKQLQDIVMVTFTPSNKE